MNTVIVHQRNSLQCYFSDRDGVVSVTFPAEAMLDMDIRSEGAYQQAIHKMLGSKAAQTVPSILILADDICYISQSKPEEVEAKTKTLVANTPFTHVETVALSSQNLVYIVAVNADIYETAQRSFTALGFPINLVVPWGALTFYRLHDGGAINRLTVKRLFDFQSELKKAAFPMTITPLVQTTDAGGAKIQKKAKLSFGWIIFISLALLYAIGMLWFMLRK